MTLKGSRAYNDQETSEFSAGYLQVHVAHAKFTHDTWYKYLSPAAATLVHQRALPQMASRHLAVRDLTLQSKKKSPPETLSSTTQLRTQ